MSPTVIILSILLTISIVVTCLLYRACGILAKNNSDLKILMRAKDQQILSMELRQAIQPAQPLVLNEKTHKLLVLAVNSNNANEAAAAAKQVCKRIFSGKY